MKGKLALDGGNPVRREMLPYGRQTIESADVEAVRQALQDDLITTGPRVDAFEEAFAQSVGARHAVAVSSGTAALHCAVQALRLSPGDEVIVPSMTFAATANAALFVGARPLFADVDPETLLIDPASLDRLLGRRSKAVIAVDYAGQPCDYPALGELAGQRGVALLADACHAPGAQLDGRPVGSLAEMSCFSLHPVKHLTCGEGGMITTDDAGLAEDMRRFRNHGISLDHRARRRKGSWYYEISRLGYNYRLTDIQCALGLSQLSRLDSWVARRRAIAQAYDQALSGMEAVRPLKVRPGVEHAYHLYVVRLDLDRLRVGRTQVFQALRAEGIGVNVHYIPVHLHPFYRRELGTSEGLCPNAEAAYQDILTLPLFPAMAQADQSDVLTALQKVLHAYRR
ncbi:MAG TPA: UDP-4-amino-4,6-dideoxy-N-acetyl-beta-L-altrosamine transaminase [Acidobacteriota bacterium]|nr:UDP-4-amino-4,6-dideoxy-N-acetyl-beta-L-altrosamine transaminase [Acidobacteriota bacterium]